MKGWTSDTITSVKASDVPFQKKNVPTIFSLNDTLQDFQQFSKSFSCGLRLSEVKFYCARHSDLLGQWRHSCMLSTSVPGGQYSASRPGRFSHEETASRPVSIEN